MSSRTVVVSVLVVAACLLLAVVTLAMLSAESDPAIIEGPPAFLTGEMPASTTTEACGDPADRISRC
jgi:hypothetical protein